MERYNSGDNDYIRHSLDLFLDFINIFRRLLVILASKVRVCVCVTVCVCVCVTVCVCVCVTVCVCLCCHSKTVMELSFKCVHSCMYYLSLCHVYLFFSLTAVGEKGEEMTVEHACIHIYISSTDTS